MFGGVEARTANVVPVATDSARRGPPGSPEGREGGFKRSSRAHTHPSDFMGAAGAGGGCEALLGLKLVEWPSRASLRAGLTARACSESVRARVVSVTEGGGRSAREYSSTRSSSQTDTCWGTTISRKDALVKHARRRIHRPQVERVHPLLRDKLARACQRDPIDCLLPDGEVGVVLN